MTIAKNPKKLAAMANASFHRMQAYRQRIAAMVGSSVGRLTILSIFCSGKHSWFKVRCSCGKEKAIRATSVIAGHTKSCGCINSERVRSRNTKHGLAVRGKHAPEYAVWCGMKRRCLNKADKQYDRYGGRGITVCRRWLTFENFYADMGPRPSPEMSLDRIDNIMGYNP